MKKVLQFPCLCNSGLFWMKQWQWRPADCCSELLSPKSLVWRLKQRRAVSVQRPCQVICFYRISLRVEEKIQQAKNNKQNIIAFSSEFSVSPTLLSFQRLHLFVSVQLTERVSLFILVAFKVLCLSCNLIQWNTVTNNWLWSNWISDSHLRFKPSENYPRCAQDIAILLHACLLFANLAQCVQTLEM